MSNRALTLMMGVVAALIVVVGVAFIAILAAGSGDDDDGGSRQSSPDGNNKSGGSSSSAGSAICEGNSLITFGGDPLSVLDPIQVRDEGTAEYMVEIFGGLVTLDLDLKVQPDIAEKWDISPDGKTYTFTLRNNVVFHNGERVTAEDVRYSLERAADPKNNSPTASLYLSEIVGFKERFTGKAAELSGVKVIDNKTLQIQILEPAQFFLAELTYPVAYVVQKSQVEKDPRNWTRNPNGTGPFKLKSFQPAEKIVLVRNDRYHLGAPKLDEVVFELAGGSIFTRYENNELHIGAVPAGEIEAVKAGSSPLSAEYRPSKRMAIGYIAFNPSKAPFDDPKVRQALTMAVDRELIADVLFFGATRVADGILPPEMPGYTESVKALPFDAARARQLLSESKYARNMPRITLTFGGSAGDSPATLEALQSAWKDNLGVDVELQAVDSAAFLRELRKKTFQAFATGWAADYPDPEDFLDKLFFSNSEQNEQGYASKEVDDLLLQARYERDQKKRTQLYAQAEQLILDDAAIIPTFWPEEHLLVKPCVKGWANLSMVVPRYRFIEIKAE